MSYVVLARKYRPQTFATVVGQEHITTALANAIVRGKVAHALLFTGPRGVGKTSLARVLARALNCTGRSLDGLGEISEEEARKRVEPCGECVNCKEIAKSTSLSVWEIDGASNNSVDNVRELIESLRSVPPAGSAYKIYIIDEVHMLSTAAFNALLKSLEEPPPHTKFIFATTEPHKIPETVLSRCQQHNFHRLTMDRIAKHLAFIADQEGIKAESDVFEFIARRAEGGMRDAETLLDRLHSFAAGKVTLADALQVFGAVDRQLFFRISQAVLNQNAEESLKYLAEVFGQSVDLRAFVADFVNHWRSLLLITLAKSGEIGGLAHALELTKRELAELQEQASSQELIHVQRLFDIAQKTADTALMSNFPRYVLEAGLIKMATAQDLRSVAEIISRLESGVGATSGSAPRASLESRGASIKTTSKATSATQPAQRQTPPQSGEIPKPITDESLQENSGARADSSEFTPSWHDFIEHVKSRSEVVLAAHLRRASAIEFYLGRLSLRAAKFDLDIMKEKAGQQALRTCLYSYSGHNEWTLIFEEMKENEDQHQVPEGSLAMIEAKRERERVKQIEDEARANPLVQSALSTFSGSKIEKVSVLKR